MYQTSNKVKSIFIFSLYFSSTNFLLTCIKYSILYKLYLKSLLLTNLKMIFDFSILSKLLIITVNITIELLP